MEDLNTCNDLICKHGNGLHRALTEVEQLESGMDVSSKIKVINERATMFRITSNAMINVSYGFILYAPLLANSADDNYIFFFFIIFPRNKL